MKENLAMTSIGRKKRSRRARAGPAAANMRRAAAAAALATTTASSLAAAVGRRQRRYLSCSSRSRHSHTSYLSRRTLATAALPPRPTLTSNNLALDALVTSIKKMENESAALEESDVDRVKSTRMATDFADDFLNLLDGRKALVATPGRAAALLAEAPIQEEPKSMGHVMQLMGRHVVDEGFTTASGRFMGFIPSGGLYTSALADYLAAVTNKFTGVFPASPGGVRLENQLLRWMSSVFGYDPNLSSGNLTSGGSIANLLAVTTAREAMDLRAADYHNAVFYFSTEAHHCIDKAIWMAGMNDAVVRKIPVDSKLKMKVDLLKEAIKEDKANGLNPFFLMGTAGTTNSGSIDPLDALANVAREEEMWYHVDAAYGGFFMLCLDMADKFKGIERSDSLTVDPHKGLNLPTGTGAIIVRDGRYLRVGGNRYGSYMQDIIDGSELSPTDVSPELSRHFRGLRMWLPLQLYGVTAFRAMLAEKRLLALYFRSAIARQPNFEVGPEPDLSVVLFRFVPDDCRDHTLVNKMIAESVARDGRVFFSSTTVEGIFWLRLAVLNFRTHLPHVDEAVAAIKEIAAKVWKQNET